MKEHFARSRVIWDVATIAYLVDQNWTPNDLIHSPIVSEDFRWSVDSSRHFIRYVNFIDRDQVFMDFFKKLS
ncbi:hypothetical protein D3C84_1201680 [compost metagenome]